MMRADNPVRNPGETKVKAWTVVKAKLLNILEYLIASVKAIFGCSR